MKKRFILGYLFGLLLFFSPSDYKLNLLDIEKTDLKLLKNEIIVLNANKNVFAKIYESSVFDVVEVRVTEKEESSLSLSPTTKKPLDIKTKKMDGGSSIFVEAFKTMRLFPARPSFNYYDPVQNQFVKKSVMLKAHITCLKEVDKLPRKIDKKDRNVKFNNKKYRNLLRKEKNYAKVFGYNLYLEENLGKSVSKTEIGEAEQRLVNKYIEPSKDFLKVRLFENPSIIKSKECKYLDTDRFVTLYYDQFTDLFAIVDLKKNSLLDFGIATEVKYAEIFAYKSSDLIEREKICVKLDDAGKNPKLKESKALEIYTQQKYVLSEEEALAILREKYGSNFVAVEENEFKIQDWQAAKKIKHALAFDVSPENFGFSQYQAKQINAAGGIVAYVRKLGTLPNLDLIRAYQNAIKVFCEDRNQSVRNDESVFRGAPAITFVNEKTRQIVVFGRESKKFITAYRLSSNSLERYLATGEVGEFSSVEIIGDEL